MFESLDEQIRIDEHKMTSNRQRMMVYLLTLLIAIVIFGGIYLGMHLLQGS